MSSSPLRGHIAVRLHRTVPAETFRLGPPWRRGGLDLDLGLFEEAFDPLCSASSRPAISPLRYSPGAARGHLPLHDKVARADARLLVECARFLRGAHQHVFCGEDAKAVPHPFWTRMLMEATPVRGRSLWTGSPPPPPPPGRRARGPARPPGRPLDGRQHLVACNRGVGAGNRLERDVFRLPGMLHALSRTLRPGFPAEGGWRTTRTSPSFTWWTVPATSPWHPFPSLAGQASGLRGYSRRPSSPGSGGCPSAIFRRPWRPNRSGRP